MDSQLLMLRQMLSGDHLPLVVLSGLFVALLFRRESINSFGLFRLGYIFFIVSLVMPAIDQSLLVVINPPNSFRNGLGDGASFAILNLLGPISLAVGLMCILGSLMPLRVKRSPFMPPAPPQKHPLDE